MTQKLTIGIKLDDKIAYLKTIEIQENANVAQKLINLLNVFIEHNLNKENEDAEDECNG